MQNFRALGAPPQTPVPLAAEGFALKPPASSTDPHWPPATGGSAPRHPKQPPHCEFLATRLNTSITRLNTIILQIENGL